MKKEKIIFIISLVMMIFSASVSVYATSCLYNSSDVSYTAPSGSGLSANVQDSLTEVYGHCTDYTSMDTRVNALEGHFQNNSISFFDGNGTDEWLNIKKIDTGARGIKIFDASDVQRSRFYYHPGTDKTYVAAYNSTGTGGQGTLDLLGNPVMINGNIIGQKKYETSNWSINSPNTFQDLNTVSFKATSNAIVFIYGWMNYSSNAPNRQTIIFNGSTIASGKGDYENAQHIHAVYYANANDNVVITQKGNWATTNAGCGASLRVFVIYLPRVE